MQEQRIPGAGCDPATVERQTDHEVLALMFHDTSWPWSLDELARELGTQGEVDDAVRRLVGVGLVHHHGAFVFPTRAARRAYELQLGAA